MGDKNSFNSKLDKTAKVCLISLVSPKHTVLAENYGISVLSGYIQDNFAYSVDLSVFDQQFIKVEDIANQVMKNDFDIIGISIPIGGYPSLKELMPLIENSQAYPIVLGGELPSHAPKELLGDFQDERLVICTGEGEVALRNIIEQHFLNKIEFQKINNIAYFDDGGSYVVNPIVLQENLAELPLPDRKLARMISKLGGQIYIEASRGCSWNRCTFCAIREKGLNRRWFSPKQVLKNLEECGNFVNQDQDIVFTDEEFIGNDCESLNTILEITKELVSRNSQVSFTLATRVDSVINSKDDETTAAKRDKVFAELVQAGLSSVFIGVESGSNSQLKRYGKGAKAEDNLAAISKLKTLGIRLDIGIILFDPLMTLEEILENIEFVEKADVLGLISVLPHEIRVQKNTPLHTMVENWQKKNNHKIIDELDLNNLNYPVVNYADVRVGKIAQFSKNWHECYYELWYALKGRIRSLSDGHTRSTLMKYYKSVQTIESKLIRDLSTEMMRHEKFNNDNINEFRIQLSQKLDELNSLLENDRTIDTSGKIKSGIAVYKTKKTATRSDLKLTTRHHQLI